MQGHVTPRAALPFGRRFGQASLVSDRLQEAFVLRLTPLFAVLFALFLAAPSSAAVPHVVQSGETLWSIAAANNLTTRTVAAFNGLSENSQVVLGFDDSGSVGRRGLCRAAEGGACFGSGSAAPACAAAPAAAAVSQPLGGYTVRPGDTLSGLAAVRVSVSAIAAMNGLDAGGVLLAGTVIKLPDRRARPGARCPARPRHADRAPGGARADRDPPGRRRRAVGRRRSTASPPRSPTAIAWQESGFNNGDGLRAPTRAASCR